jgi:hypothetical protein
LVTSTAEEMKLVEEIVDSIDVVPEREMSENRSNSDPYLQVYELNSADAQEVAKTLTVLHPGMVINEDGRTRRIHIWATGDEHREIEAHIRQLDGAAAGEAIAIINLQGMSAYDVSTKLTALYANDSAGAPVIETDPSAMGLIVKGNAGQIGQIRSLVDQLAVQGPTESQRAVQLVPVSSGSSAFVQEAIGALYPQITVTTSETTDGASSTASRDGRSRSGEERERDERFRRFMERARMGDFLGRGFGRGRGGDNRDGNRGRNDRGGNNRGGNNRGDNRGGRGDR